MVKLGNQIVERLSTRISKANGNSKDNTDELTTRIDKFHRSIIHNAEFAEHNDKELDIENVDDGDD